MKKDSISYRNFRAAVHGWAFANERGVNARLLVTEPLIKLIVDPAEKKQAQETIQAMKESLT